MARICLIALVAVCCLAMLVSAGPTRRDHGHHRGYPLRNRSGATAATSIAEARALHGEEQQEEQPAEEDVPEERDEEEKPEAEQPEAQDEPQEQPEQPEQDEPVEEEPTPAPAPVKPRKPAHRGSQRKRRPSKDDSENDGHQGGVTAIARSVSVGVGAKSLSHALAYGGHYNGGHFNGGRVGGNH